MTFSPNPSTSLEQHGFSLVQMRQPSPVMTSGNNNTNNTAENEACYNVTVKQVEFMYFNYISDFN